MNRFRISVTEINSTPVEGAGETEVFKIVIDQFDPAAFTKAVTAQPRAKRRKAKTQEAAT